MNPDPDEGGDDRQDDDEEGEDASARCKLSMKVSAPHFIMSSLLVRNVQSHREMASKLYIGDLNTECPKTRLFCLGILNPSGIKNFGIQIVQTI